MYYPKLNAPAQTRVTISKFLGYDCRQTGEPGSFTEMRNFCSDALPALRTRPFRGRVSNVSAPHGITAKDCLIWVDGRTLFINGQAAPLTLADSDKHLIGMGAYLVIWPDKKYINTQDWTDCGSLENSVTVSGDTVCRLCRADGTELSGYTVSDQAPEQPEEGALWMDADHILRQYTAGMWQEVEDICLLLSASGIGAGFAEGDGIAVSALTGSYLVLRAEDNSLLLRGALTLDSTLPGPVTLRRYVPDMDYIVECGNRLWGCKYGMVDGKPVNEIYASALGDFKNWNTFAGLSTDSYAVSRGSDGQFTGAVTHLGSPIFFKENCMERVYPSAVGAHQVVTVTCPGIKKGCHRSPAVVDGTLFYLGTNGVYAFDGSLPVPVSQALGSAVYSNGIGGALGSKYYLSVTDSSGERHLLVYDLRRRLWHHEDDLAIQGFAACDGELFAMTSNTITALHGTVGTLESSITWNISTGELGLDTPYGKYLQRLELRMYLSPRSMATAYISYDGGSSWESVGSVPISSDERPKPAVFHIHPRRCPQLRLKLTGIGQIILYSVSAVYEKGSDQL